MTVASIAEAVPVHLKRKQDVRALCGAEGPTVHPSKATKTSCAACRAEWRRIEAARKAAVAIEPTPMIEPVIEPVAIEPTPIEPTSKVAERTKPKPKPTTAAGRWRPTIAEVSKVRSLRAKGHSLMAIEEAMGWPDQHGCRAWRIIKGKAKPVDGEE